MELSIPLSVRVEHDELNADLVQAAQKPGRIGEAAILVAALMRPHFLREEEFALPPLALLPALTEGKITPSMAGVLRLTEKLEAELPRMLEEHRQIVIALENLKQVAQEEGSEACAELADRAILHAQNEEEVTYPASILIGEYLKLRFGPPATP